MASISTGSMLSGATGEKCFRTEMEELLFAFYHAVGISSWHTSRDLDVALLADEFQGRFFIRASSELLCYDKTAMLATKLENGEFPRASCLLCNMNPASFTEEGASVNYATAFRRGETVIVRRGLLKAIPVHGKWVLLSVDEDVRVVLLQSPPRRKPSVAWDRPRVWIL